MKRYDMSEHYREEWDSLMEEDENGRWIKWKGHNEFMIYISGVLEGMGMSKKDVNNIFKEYECLIDYIGERK